MDRNLWGRGYSPPPDLDSLTDSQKASYYQQQFSNIVSTLNVVWENTKDLKAEIDRIKDNASVDRTSLTVITTHINEIDRTIDNFCKTGGNRCAERGSRISEIESKINSSQCNSCDASSQIQIVKDRVDNIMAIVKWGGAIITSGIILAFLKEIWTLITNR